MDQYIFIYPFSAISLSAIHRVMKSVMNGRYASSAIRYTFVRTTDEKCDEWHIMHINTFIYPLSAIHYGEQLMKICIICHSSHFCAHNWWMEHQSTKSVNHMRISTCVQVSFIGLFCKRDLYTSANGAPAQLMNGAPEHKKVCAQKCVHHDEWQIMDIWIYIDMHYLPFITLYAWLDIHYLPFITLYAHKSVFTIDEWQIMDIWIYIFIYI